MSASYGGGRRFGYHMLHHGNLFSRHSPLIRAVLAVFGCALPLDFIDAPFALLRSSFDKFLASETTANAVAAAIAIIAAQSAAPFSAALNASATASGIFAGSGSVGDAAASLGAAGAASSSAGAPPLASVPTAAGFARSNSIVVSSTVAAAPAIPGSNKVVVAMMQIFGQEFASTAGVPLAAIAGGASGISSTTRQVVYAGGFGAVDVMQMQHALQLDSGVQRVVDELIRIAAPAQYRKAIVFDWAAGIGKRPLAPSEAPSLALRCVVDLFLRRHERVAAAVELAACAVARPLGDTAQMVVPDGELLRALAALRVDTTTTHPTAAVHPSLLRALDCLGSSAGRRLSKLRLAAVTDIVNSLPAVSVPLSLSSELQAEKDSSQSNNVSSGGGAGLNDSVVPTAVMTHYDLQDFVQLVWCRGVTVE